MAYCRLRELRREVLEMKDTMLKQLALVLGAIGTILGAIGTVQSQMTNDYLQKVKVQMQSDADFADAISHAGQTLALHDKDGTRAMVEFLSLYARTESVPHKLVIVEMAQTAKQGAAMVALSGVARADDGVQNPRPDSLIAADAIKSDIVAFANEEFTRSQPFPSVEPTPGPTSSAARLGRPSNEFYPAGDPPLTQSRSSLVRANAALVAALPATRVSGWIFIGDASGGQQGNAYANLDSRTDVISSTTVPHAGLIVTACHDVNIREKPFENGSLGPIVGIAPRGSLLLVNQPAPQSFDTISAIQPHDRIAAKWIYVTLQQSTAQLSEPLC